MPPPTISLSNSHTTSSAATLPSGYQQVEYIKSNGTQWIDTGVPGSNSNLSFEVRYSFVELPASDSYSHIFSSYQNEDSVATRIIQHGDDTTYYTINSKAGKSGVYNGTRTVDSIYTDFLYSESDTMRYSTNNGSSTKTRESGTNSSANIAILAGGSSGGNAAHRGRIRLYYLKILNDDTLIRFYIPCIRKSDNTVGLYDTVNGTFLTKSSGDVFEYGRNVTTQSVSSALTIPAGDFAIVSVTPESGYYLSSVSCPTNYTCTNYNTGSSYTRQQTIIVTNNGATSSGTLSFTAQS